MNIGEVSEAAANATGAPKHANFIVHQLHVRNDVVNQHDGRYFQHV